ncbi:hypothetical protein HNQ60_001203 [Povalibacter uvarum]|uniref:Uncharacterized protein n=1 Tax=Povalibacter uvarum TaxID=732238 RepID=A0A841HHD0_9GAMM|nr:hypothetical protein [Povalibacter uvarum]MBB6092357.1 hypothetical protein [Povalibacter uvarum]
MKKIVLAPLLAAVAQVSVATTVTCPAQESLAGEYEAAAAPGFTSNKLIVSASSRASYSIALSSYWAPKPFDDGAQGTVGDFSGELVVPHPWSCVAFLEVSDKGKSDETTPVACFLLLRFVDTSSINVSTLGQCEYFHGHRATPAGSYKRRGS